MEATQRCHFCGERHESLKPSCSQLAGLHERLDKVGKSTTRHFNYLWREGGNLNEIADAVEAGRQETEAILKELERVLDRIKPTGSMKVMYTDQVYTPSSPLENKVLEMIRKARDSNLILRGLTQA